MNDYYNNQIERKNDINQFDYFDDIKRVYKKYENLTDGDEKKIIDYIY